MIIFLHGSDTYRSRRKLNEIIEGYRKIHKSGLNLKIFEEEDVNFPDFQNSLNSASMFKEKKLFVLKNISSNQQFKKEFLKQKEKLARMDDIILIYEKKDLPAKDQFFQFLKKQSKAQEFKLLEGEKLKIWIKKELLNYKAPRQNRVGAGQAEIEPEALELLVNYVGNDLWALSNEIKKLANYTRGRKVKTGDVKLLVRPKIENDIFKTVDAISEKKKNLALNLIHKHLEKGDSPLYLLTMINFQFRNLLEIKDLIEKNTPYYRILSQSNLHPFIVKKSYRLAQRFAFNKLKKIYRKIFQADLAIKTGKIDPETALDLLIAEV